MVTGIVANPEAPGVVLVPGVWFRMFVLYLSFVMGAQLQLGNRKVDWEDVSAVSGERINPFCVHFGCFIYHPEYIVLVDMYVLFYFCKVIGFVD